MIYSVIVIIAFALIFDFLNGFHDAANSIATVVATRVLTPLRAVMWAAFFNFIAAFGFGLHVAKTVGKGIIHPEFVDIYVILAALIGAIVWDLVTWYAGLPTSSSHALIGGFAGAAIAKAGNFAPLMPQGLYTVSAFIVLSPLIGMILGFTIMTIVLWICRHMPPGRVDKHFRRLQLLSAASYSLGHGLNDAQKTMGIIWALLLATGFLGKAEPFPYWGRLACNAAIALGTMAGGWRIVKTMGLRITKLRPVGGFGAETAGALTIIGASSFGIPVSTTHTITGAIVGVGATTRLSAVRWGVAGRIVWAWILTIPMSAVVSAASYFAIRPFVT